MVPVTRYAKSGEVSIAYQIIGEGPPDLVLVPGFVSHVEAAWQWPYLARFLNRLGSIARLITFDKRGTGLSDPMTRPPSLEERMDDIRAVMDATGCERAPLLGVSEGGALSIKFASEHPERVASLVLYGSYAKKLSSEDYPWGVSPQQLELFQSSFDDAWATGLWWDIVNPDLEIDPASREAWARYLRASASPGMARDLLAQNAKLDVRDLLSTIDVPTLVIHRRDDRWVGFGNARYLADRITGATLVELEGSDHRAWLEDADAVLDAVEAFVAPGRPRPRHTRVKIGVEALSRREREIVQLAADGESTPSIARRLFVSERTVESHLANAYVKLGVHSRLELARRAAEFEL
jgi:pimeloyl-ACP methyl ester carboxylesterase/DNA-binding CsgD family transcriptional regulator